VQRRPVANPRQAPGDADRVLRQGREDPRLRHRAQGAGERL